MLKITAPFESFLTIKGFTAEVIDQELTVWTNNGLIVYLVRRIDGSNAYDGLFRKDVIGGKVEVEMKFAIEKSEDIPPIESFINFHLPNSPWNMRDR